MITIKPLVGLPACVTESDGLPFHKVGDKYVRAVALAADALPVTIPALGDAIDLGALVERLDGLLLTGSPSNVYPDHYGVEPHEAAEPYDHPRDATTLPLIREALNQGLPFLAICRGFQELNVALGGSLFSEVQEIEGRLDHRRPQDPDFDVQYGAKHEVTFEPGGIFAELAGRTVIETNSLHRQAVNQVAPSLRVEGRAPDGTVEAVSVRDAECFALGVQWHPEYKAWDPSFTLDDGGFSRRLFTAFGKAARARAESRLKGQNSGLSVGRVA